MKLEWKRNLGKGTSLNKDMELRNITVCLETIKATGVAGLGRCGAGEIGIG